MSSSATVNTSNYWYTTLGFEQEDTPSFRKSSGVVLQFPTNPSSDDNRTTSLLRKTGGGKSTTLGTKNNDKDTATKKDEDAVVSLEHWMSEFESRIKIKEETIRKRHHQQELRDADEVDIVAQLHKRSEEEERQRVAQEEERRQTEAAAQEIRDKAEKSFDELTKGLSMADKQRWREEMDELERLEVQLSNINGRVGKVNAILYASVAQYEERRKKEQDLIDQEQAAIEASLQQQVAEHISCQVVLSTIEYEDRIYVVQEEMEQCNGIREDYYQSTVHSTDIARRRIYNALPPVERLRVDQELPLTRGVVLDQMGEIEVLSHKLKLQKQRHVLM